MHDLSDLPRPAVSRAPSWRRRLAAVAVAAVTCAAASVVTPPAAAASTPFGGPFPFNAGTVTGGYTDSGAPTVSGATSNTAGPDHSVIHVTGARTVLHLSSLTLSQGDRLDIVFSPTRSTTHDVVLLDVDGPVQIDGQLNAFVGMTGTAPGGNVWISGGGGVAFGGTADVTVGGLLATTADIATADFFAGNHAFSQAPAGSAVSIVGAATLTALDSGVTLVAPQVVKDGFSTVVGGNFAEVLYGAAAGFQLTSATDVFGRRKLTGFVVPPDAPGSQNSSTEPNPLNINGLTVAANVYLASVTSSAINGIVAGSPIVLGFPANGDGHLVVSAGAGIARALPSGPMEAVPHAGAVPQDVRISAPLNASDTVRVFSTGDITVQRPITTSLTGAANEVRLVADGDLSLDAPISTGTVVLATDGTLTNPGGAAHVLPSGGRWLVYAPAPANVLNSNLDSGTNAIWGSDLASRPPATIPATSYVFAERRTLTFSSMDQTKTYGLAWTDADFRFVHDGAARFHAGLPGRFLADTAASVFGGGPHFESDGAAATAPERAGGGTYPVDISQGGMRSLSGYDFAFLDVGQLFVDDLTPPEVTPVVTPAATGAWFTTDVDLTWNVVDPGSETVTRSPGCAPVQVRQDQAPTTYTCTATSGGGTTEVFVVIGRDATAPTLAITGLADPTGGQRAYASGTWTNQDVAVSFDCTDLTSGVARVRTDETLTTPGTTYYTETCEDVAGNPSTAQTFVVNIDRTAPTPALPTAVLTGTTVPYGFGNWTNEDVTVSWGCTDAGGAGAVDETVTVPVSSTMTVTPVCVDRAGNSAQGDPVQVNIDKVDPVLHDVPADLLLHSTGAPVVATWTDPTATDDRTAAPAVTCTPGSGTSFAPGRTTVTCTATDLAGNTDSASFTVRVGLVAVTFDRPLDPAPVMNVAKIGRVLPLKAVLTVDGVPVTGPSSLPVSVAVAKVSCTSGAGTDTVETYGSSGSSNTGNLFRWDAAGSRWVYNLDTGALGMTANSCYRVGLHYAGTLNGSTATGGTLAGFVYVQPRK